MYQKIEDQMRYHSYLNISADMVAKSESMKLTDKTAIGREVVRIAVGMMDAEREIFRNAAHIDKRLAEVIAKDIG